jgi:large subunit ribosomal protein L4
MEVAVINASQPSKSSALQVADAVFANEYNEPLIHQVVVAYQSNARQGTRLLKNRSAVRGGGAKPWRQKGTGRARAGTSRGPLWRSGGATFGGQKTNHKQKVNRKMYRGAMRSILSELLRQERLVVVDDFSLSEPKTKALVEKLKTLKLENVLIVADNIDQNLFLAARNLIGVDAVDAAAVNPVSLVHYDHVLVTAGCIKQFEEQLA